MSFAKTTISNRYLDTDSFSNSIDLVDDNEYSLYIYNNSLATES